MQHGGTFSLKKQTSKDLLSLTLQELLIRRSFEEITVGELLETSGISRATFYKHFYGKEALLCYTADRMFGFNSADDDFFCSGAAFFKRAGYPAPFHAPCRAGARDASPFGRVAAKPPARPCRPQFAGCGKRLVCRSVALRRLSGIRHHVSACAAGKQHFAPVRLHPMRLHGHGFRICSVPPHRRLTA